MKAAFFRRVEHDLRGELATMMAGLHYALRYEKSVTGSAREMLERVHGAGERLKRLLDELGDAAWIEGASDEGLSAGTYDVGALIEGAVDKLSRAAAARGVTLDVRPGKQGGSFRGDPDVLRAALEYATDLAIARSRDQAITLAWEIVDGRPVVTITDQAGPVVEDRLGNLLEPFAEQAIVPGPAPGTRKRDRLGLGLAIAHGMLEAHGGSFEVASDGTGLVQRLALGAPGSEAADGGLTAVG